MTARQIKKLVDHLFTRGEKEAQRLVLVDAEGRYLGGWGRYAVASVIADHCRLAAKEPKPIPPKKAKRKELP